MNSSACWNSSVTTKMPMNMSTAPNAETKSDISIGDDERFWNSFFWKLTISASDRMEITSIATPVAVFHPKEEIDAAPIATFMSPIVNNTRPTIVLMASRYSNTEYRLCITNRPTIWGKFIYLANYYFYFYFLVFMYFYF